jgi:hypothetical protein
MEKHLLPQSSKTKIVLKYDVLRSKLTAKEWYVICESEVSSWFFHFLLWSLWRASIEVGIILPIFLAHVNESRAY